MCPSIMAHGSKHARPFRPAKQSTMRRCFVIVPSNFASRPKVDTLFDKLQSTVSRYKGASRPSSLHSAIATFAPPLPLQRTAPCDAVSALFGPILSGDQKSTHHKPKFNRPYLIHVVAPTGCSKAHVVAPVSVRTASHHRAN